MASTTFTERYVDAAMRTVPEAQRADLSAELRAAIADQTEARAEAGENRESAERAVLESLGDPEKLAASYTDRTLHLIGPRYYLLWWRLVKLLWCIVTPLAAFGIALGQTLAGAPLGEIIGTTWAGTLGAVVHVAFWTTLVFAVVERSTSAGKDDLTGPWTLDQLPEPRQRGVQLSDVVAVVVMLGLTAAALVWDARFGLLYLDSQWHGFLHPSLTPWWIGGAVVLMAASVAVTVVAYARGRWTYRRAATKAVLDLAVVVGVLWLLAQERLLDVAPWVVGVPDDGAQVARIVTVVVAFVIVGVCVADAVDAVVKARRSR